MKLLLDTHLLLWSAAGSKRLSTEARALIEDPANEPWFSVTSLWEIVIKSALGRADFTVDASVLRRGLSDNGYRELSIEARHAITVASLPRLHADPFDRLLIGQARNEGLVFLTADRTLAGYGSPRSPGGLNGSARAGGMAPPTIRQAALDRGATVSARPAENATVIRSRHVRRRAQADLPSSQRARRSRRSRRARSHRSVRTRRSSTARSPGTGVTSGSSCPGASTCAR